MKCIAIKRKEYTTIPETNGWEIFTFDDNLTTIMNSSFSNMNLIKIYFSLFFENKSAHLVECFSKNKTVLAS
jgi:hypothetical protein